MNRITTTAAAEQAIGDVTTLIEQLSGIMEQETALVHAGRPSQAIELGVTKSQLAGELFAYSERLRTDAKFLLQSVPAQCAALLRRHEAFREVMQRNMIVLATTHAVSEGIVRRLSGDLARKAAPQVYGASGRTAAPSPRHGQPLALSRKL
jgi:hypothetical protein